MPTTLELYDRLGIAERKRQQAMRAMEREGYRLEKPATLIHPDCKERGHYILGSWAVQTTPSGKRYAKCGRCDQGYELPSDFQKFKNE